VTQGDTALSGRRWDQALGLYDQALRLEPQNTRAQAGKARATAAVASAKKSFVTGRTIFLGKPKKAAAAGFDTNEEADPDYQGSITFEVQPNSVVPGDNYTVKVYLANEGKKAIRVNGINVTTIRNGQRSPAPGSPQTREVAPGQKGLLTSVGGSWADGTTNWSLEAVVTSGRSETYTGRLNWR